LSKGTTPSGPTHEPSTSHTQILERQLSVEVSSFSKHADKYKGIKDTFREIKMRNEQLKEQPYAQYLKLTSTNQTSLMSTFEIKEGNMQMAFI